MPAARNTLVQLLALCTNPESHNEARVTDRQTDGRQYYANSRSYCVEVRSAKTNVRRTQLLIAMHISFFSKTQIHLFVR